jgi:protein tyrosine phosphatase
MLTNFVEKDCLKADLYWEPKGKIMKFSGLLVQLVGEEESSRSTSTDGFLKRTFKIWLDGSKEKFRLVQQLQLISWPDHGVLKDFRVIAPLLEAVNNHHYTAQLSSKVQDSRIVVHCSAGIGRSGTFIAIDMILKGIVQSLEIEDEAERLLSLKKALNIQEIVLRIRSQRPGMVQTLVSSFCYF